MIHIFDGATGTMLQKSVLKPGMCPELLNIEAPEAIQNVHRAYVEAALILLKQIHLVLLASN